MDWLKIGSYSKQEKLDEKKTESIVEEESDLSASDKEEEIVKKDEKKKSKKRKKLKKHHESKKHKHKRSRSRYISLFEYLLCVQVLFNIFASLCLVDYIVYFIVNFVLIILSY